MGSVDNATLELLAAWKAEDATTDPEKLRQADEEVAEFSHELAAFEARNGADVWKRIAHRGSTR